MPSLPTGGPPTLTDVLAALTGQVDYLRVAVEAPVEDGWLRCGALLGDPGALAESIRATAAGRGAPNDMVAASLYVQAYAFRLATVVLGPFALGLSVPHSTPSQTAIRLARHRPAAVATLSPAMTDLDAAGAAEALLGGHLAGLVEVVSNTFKIGRRLLWGNVAASCMTVFRALEGAPAADRVVVQERAGAFFAAASPWLAGLGQFDVVTAGERVGWYWTRNACCLWYQCSGGQVCDDCSLTSPEDLFATRRGQLIGGSS